MYAVIETGGKQYRVQPGDIIQIEKLEGQAGEKVQFSQVLLCAGGEASALTIGKPYLSGALVQGEVVAQGRGEKILIIKMKRRKGYRKTQGHRQEQTQVLITGLDSGSGLKASLSAEESKAKLASFQTLLRPRGGLVKEAPEAEASEEKAPAKKATAPKAAAAKKTTKK
jgi:large subunit ribosomal protein L21